MAIVRATTIPPDPGIRSKQRGDISPLGKLRGELPRGGSAAAGPGDVVKKSSPQTCMRIGGGPPQVGAAAGILTGPLCRWPWNHRRRRQLHAASTLRALLRQRRVGPSSSGRPSPPRPILGNTTRSPRYRHRRGPSEASVETTSHPLIFSCVCVGDPRGGVLQLQRAAWAPPARGPSRRVMAKPCGAWHHMYSSKFY